MSLNKVYEIYKDSSFNSIMLKNFNAEESYEIKPKSKVNSEAMLNIAVVNIYKRHMIEAVILRKIYLKMEAVIKKINDSDDTTPSGLKVLLDEVDKIRNIIKNKYAKQLEEAQIEQLLVKTSYIIQEVGIRAIEKEDELLRKNRVEYEKEGKSR